MNVVTERIEFRLMFVYIMDMVIDGQPHVFEVARSVFSRGSRSDIVYMVDDGSLPHVYFFRFLSNLGDLLAKS